MNAFDSTLLLLDAVGKTGSSNSPRTTVLDFQGGSFTFSGSQEFVVPDDCVASNQVSSPTVAPVAPTLAPTVPATPPPTTLVPVEETSAPSVQATMPPTLQPSEQPKTVSP